jgi:hypothetical protein
MIGEARVGRVGFGDREPGVCVGFWVVMTLGGGTWASCEDPRCPFQNLLFLF